MSNKNKMLQLVLSDEKLSSFYEYNVDEFPTFEEALNSDNTVVVAVAKVIEGVTTNSNKGNFKEVYNEVVSYLNQNML